MDPKEWFGLFAKLCKRFNHAVDQEEAADYLEFIEDAGMTEEQIRSQWKALWATREFFPRPADFLSGQAASGWRAILDAASHSYAHSPTWPAHRARIPDRAWQALQSLGGMATVSQGQQRNLIQLRDRYFDAFDRTVVEEITAPFTIALRPGRIEVEPQPADGPLKMEYMAAGRGLGPGGKRVRESMQKVNVKVGGEALPTGASDGEADS